MRNYRQISDKDRIRISRLKSCGFSLSEIARRTGFNKSSISREFKRNSDIEDIDYGFWEELSTYFPEDKVEIPEPNPTAREYWTAESAIKARKFRVWKANQVRRRKSRVTLKWVINRLKEGWSPEQISGRSKKEGPEPISHECIYNFVARDKKRGGRLFTLLKRFKKRKRRVSHRSYAGQLPGRVFIDKRPKKVEKRIRLGDLEADLIVGRKAKGYLLTVVDRVSRKVILKKLKTKKKEEVYFAICRALDEFAIARTLTVDNGKEFALHQKLRREKQIRVYFTHPYTSQEKGTVENMNGLIRYYFDSKTNFIRTSEARVKKVQDLLNNRPRKILKYLTPNEVHNTKFSKEKCRKGVALDV